MTGRIFQKKRWFVLLLFLLICSGLLGACGGNALPSEQANKCAAQSLPRVQNFTRLSGSTQTLYVSGGTNLYAFNAANGTLHWCDQLSQSWPGTASDGQVDDIQVLALDHANLYTYTENFPNNLTAFNPANGALRWSYNKGAGTQSDRIGVNVVNVPAANQTVYDGLDTMYALGEQHGTIRWQKDLAKNIDTNIIATFPVIKDGTVYVGVTDKKANTWEAGIVALDVANGNQKWLTKWPPDEGDSGGQSWVSGNLLVDQGKVFFSSLGQLDAVDARTGVAVWQDKVNPLDFPLFGADGVLYIEGSPEANGSLNLYAIDMRNGNIRWSLPASSRLYLLNGNKIYLFNEDGMVRNNTGYDLTAINAQNGKELRRTHYQLARSETGATWKLVVINNEVYLGVELTGTGTFAVHAFNLYSGVEDWSATIFGGVRGSDPNNITFIDIVGPQ